MKFFLTLRLVTVRLPSSLSHWLQVLAAGDQMKQNVTFNKIIDFTGFDHCCKHLEFKIYHKDLVLFKHWNTDMLHIISLKGLDLEFLYLQLRNCFFSPLLNKQAALRGK